jgi:pyruvate kinase
VSSYSSSDEIPGIVISMLKKMNIYEKGKKFIVTGGVPVGLPGTTNYLSVLGFD